MEMLQIRVLGGFSAEIHGNRIDDSHNRSQKPWMLIAYLICNRNRTVTQEELLHLCWEGEEKDDPANALRVVLHRTRAILEKLDIGSGMDLIRRSRDGFCWNCSLPICVDVEEFERLHKEGMAAEDDQVRLARFRTALALYTGPFLGRNMGSRWARYLADQYRTRYVDMSLAALNILSTSGRREDAIALARKVLTLEPCQEAVHRHLMEDLIALNRTEDAVALYERLRTRLLSEYRRAPEAETQQVYFHAVRLCSSPSIPLELHQVGSTETRGKNGARVCDFSFFRSFYGSAEFLITHCGLEVYNILFTIEAPQGRDLSRRTVNRTAEDLMLQLKENLKAGAALTQCADHQLLVMMSANGYDAACACGEQQVAQFYQTHPNTSVRLRYGVWRVGGDLIKP